MKTIEVTISLKGESKVETKGFTGGSCRETSRFIEQALGEKSAEQMTPEFYQQPTAQTVTNTQG